MTTVQTAEPNRRKPLRVWPGVVAVILLLVARFGVKAVIPGSRGFSLGMMWALGLALAVVLWWVFFSRARWSERLGIIILMIAGLFGTWSLKHESMGPLWFLGYAVPSLCLALVAGEGASRHLPDGPRRATIAVTILLACGVWTLVRTKGISGDHIAEFGFRWTKSSEERRLAHAGREPAAHLSAPATETPKEQPLPQAGDQPTAPPSAQAASETSKERVVIQARSQPMALPAASAGAKTAANWPGFRGPDRDGIVRVVRIETDWAASQPVEVWRQPIGPGWSSFAVRGNLVYTQEQRGDDEVVSCYNATTGAPVWRHRDATRFFESNAGAGPRGTPTLSKWSRLQVRCDRNPERAGRR